MGPWPGRLVRSLAELVFPPACPGCGGPPGPEQAWCPECAADLGLIQEPLCPRCGRPHEPGTSAGLCAWCAGGPPAFSQARSVARHQGPLARAVRQFKYQGRWHLGPALAEFMAAQAPAGLVAGADLLAPVPLHPWRLLSRGFNQALVLSRGLARGPRLAPDLLRRLRHTRPQVGLGPAARRANVAGAFGLGPGAKGGLDGSRVLLVDDVLTTGATAAECARVLLAAGAEAVAVLTLVRALGPEEDLA